MGRKKKLELTRMACPTGLPRWRKVYRGKTHYFRGEYAEALKQWHELRERLDNAPTADELALWEQHRPRPQRTFQDIVAVTGGLTDQERRALEQHDEYIKAIIEKVDRWRQQQGKPTSTTLANTAATPSASGGGGISIGDAVAKFLAFKRLAVGQGLSASRWDTLRRALGKVSDFAGEAMPLASVNEQVVSDYDAHLHLGMKHGMTPEYTATLAAAFKQWVKWCYKTALLDRMPRNLSTL